MDQKIIYSFCLEKDPRILHKLTPTAKALLIDGCFSVLFQKFGDQELATIALEELGEIRKLRYKANEAEGKANFLRTKRSMGTKAARVAWKKLSPTEKLEYRPWISSFVYTGKEMKGYQSLKRTGATIVKVLDKKDLPKAREGFLAATRSFPEYKRNPVYPNQTEGGHPLVYTLGGFAAFGNPASFHNPYVRQQRLTTREAVLPLFDTVIGLMHNEKQRAKTKFQMIADRMLYRHRSQAPSNESWHRDVTPAKYLNQGDEVYGGWLNLDLTQNQYFSFIPGSHLGVDLLELREGFASLSPEAIKIVKPYKARIAVPPGHALIFPQYILHEVVSNRTTYDMMRIFMGWRTTTSDGFLIPVTRERMEKQGIIPLPSGQEPPMYAANHASFFRHKTFRPISNIDWKVSTVEWSNETFKKSGPTGVPITLDHKGKDGKPDYRLVPRYMSSLKHYDLPMYPPYTKEELDLYLPISLNKKRVRVAFFDLDDTLICQCVKLDPDQKTSLVPVYQDKKQGTTTYSTSAIMALLTILTQDENYLWYLVSKGENIVKFQALQSTSEDNHIGVITPNTVPGISQYGNEDKGLTISKIMEHVKKSYIVEDAVFADDTSEFRDQVKAALGDEVKILDFEALAGPICQIGDIDFPLTILDDKDVARLVRILKMKNM